MRISIALVLLFSVYLLFTSCSNTETNTTLEEELEALFTNEFSTNEPGGSVLVKKGSEVVFLKSYGVADVNTQEKITENTIFNTGSISKTFVANGILILEEENLLSIEDSISMYFNDFDDVAIANRIKIKHLLSHTSGLPDVRKVSENEAFYLTAKDLENFEPLKRVTSLNFEPGEKFEYSNPAYNGLALIIEKVTGEKWQSFIEERIFQPSGMEDSRITDGPYPENRVAHAYVAVGESYKEDDYGEYPTFAASGNGGVWSSVLDLAKYEDAIREFTFLSKESVDKSRKVFQYSNWHDTIPPNIGSSWFILDKNKQKNDSGVKIIYHTGSQGGFRAFYVSIPEKDLLYIALFNRPVKGLTDFRLKGIELFKKYNWLE